MMHVVTKLGNSVPCGRDSLNVQDAHSLCQPECPWKCQSGYKERMRVSVVRRMTSLIQLQQCTMLGRTQGSYFIPFPQPSKHLELNSELQSLDSLRSQFILTTGNL